MSSSPVDEPVKEQSSVSGNGGKPRLLKYALRSATKPKLDKAEPATSSTARRTRPPTSVSKSMGVLDTSGKDKPAKSPRRLSIPTKSGVGYTPRSVGTITPISEIRAQSQRSAISQAKSETPVSDVSRSSSRRKFCVLSSASYWLQQIKLSETAAKHSISFGFFKLALEAGCEPQKLQEELKSYARRHNLTELNEILKELFNMYNITESVEQPPQTSETISQVPDDVTRSSDDEVRSSTSTVGARKIKPKSLNTDVAFSAQPATRPARGIQKNTATKVRESANRSSASSRTNQDNGDQKMQKKIQKPMKQESNIEKKKPNRQGKKPATKEGLEATPPAQDVIENKENLDVPPAEAVSSEAM